MKILISCFKPFNNEKINYSKVVLDNYNNDFDKVILDVVYNDDALRINELLDNNHYDYVFLLGEARSRSHVSLETRAINLNSAKISDNNGIYKLNEKINDNGEDYLYTNIDLALLEELVSDDVKLSNDAGTFVCNDLYYRVLDHVYRNIINTKILFIHFPKFNEDEINKYVRILDNIVRTLTN